MVLSLSATRLRLKDPKREESYGPTSLSSFVKEDMCTQVSPSSAKGIQIGHMKLISQMVLIRTLQMAAVQNLGGYFVCHYRLCYSSDMHRAKVE